MAERTSHSDKPFSNRKSSARAAAALSMALLASGLSACSVDDLLRPSADVGLGNAGVVSTAVHMPAATSRAYMTPMPPLSPNAYMPADEVDCRKQLKRLGVTFRELPPIDEGGACRIDHPVQVISLSGGIEIKPAVTLNCQMAVAFATWTKRELARAARWRYFSGIRTIRQGSGYSCRKINGTSVASEHSTGNAIDIMSITLKNGKTIDVRKPGLFAFRQRSLLNKVRSEGCDYFTTVLGPGYNRDHADHFHFDIKNRRNGYRACR